MTLSRVPSLKQLQSIVLSDKIRDIIEGGPPEGSVQLFSTLFAQKIQDTRDAALLAKQRLDFTEHTASFVALLSAGKPASTHSLQNREPVLQSLPRACSSLRNSKPMQQFKLFTVPSLNQQSPRLPSNKNQQQSVHASVDHVRQAKF